MFFFFFFLLTLLVVSDEGLADGLTDGVNLGSGSTTAHSDANVDLLEGIAAEDEDGLIELQSEKLGLEDVEGLSVDLDESLSLLAVGKGDGGFLQTHTHTRGFRAPSDRGRAKDGREDGHKREPDVLEREGSGKEGRTMDAPFGQRPGRSGRLAWADRSSSLNTARRSEKRASTMQGAQRKHTRKKARKINQ